MSAPNRKLALKWLREGIEAVRPHQLIRQHLRLAGEVLHIRDRQIFLKDYRTIRLAGAGKASAAMGVCLEQILGERISDSLIITKYDHTPNDAGNLNIRESGHPVPDQNSLAAGEALLAFAEKSQPDDLVINLISGGGSALMEALPPGVSLADLQQLSRAMLGAGIPIEAINTVRKHLSRIKGGQLARAFAPARVISLMISDVIGDPPDAIASGPTVPDPGTFADALKLVATLPPGSVADSVRRHLEAGARGDLPETPKPGDPLFGHVENIILGNNRLALERMREVIAAAGFAVEVVTDVLEGEAREIGRHWAKTVAATRPGYGQVWLFGGESTVTLTGNGKGGRNQELVLGALHAMSQIPHPFVLLSCGSDGGDGPTDAAGAIIDETSLTKSRRAGLDAADYLARNDAYHFFDPIGGLIKTGPTGTNVMDLGMIFVP